MLFIFGFIIYIVQRYNIMCIVHSNNYYSTVLHYTVIVHYGTVIILGLLGFKNFHSAKNRERL